jgi:hypothetical protein
MAASAFVVTKTTTGTATVFAFTDPVIDETYGELLCTLLRRQGAAIERASHVTDYDGFRLEVVLNSDAAPPLGSIHALKAACDVRVSQISSLLAGLE